LLGGKRLELIATLVRLDQQFRIRARRDSPGDKLAFRSATTSLAKVEPTRQHRVERRQVGLRGEAFVESTSCSDREPREQHKTLQVMILVAELMIDHRQALSVVG
jgi:hypothetical protein